MFSLNPRADMFSLFLAKDFIPQDIKDRFKYPNPSILEDVDSIINESIQSVVFPGAAQDTVSQTYKSKGPNGAGVQFRSSLNEVDLVNRTFTINFRHLDGFYSWFVLYETFWHYYNALNTWCPPIKLKLYNYRGQVMASLVLTEVLFVSISELNLDFTNASRDFSTFSCDFVFNNMSFDNTTLGVIS